jgi:hypothetical protein
MMPTSMPRSSLPSISIIWSNGGAPTDGRMFELHQRLAVLDLDDADRRRHIADHLCRIASPSR